MRSFFAGAMLLATVASTATAQPVVSATNGPGTDPSLNSQAMVLNFTDCGAAPAGVTITGGACKASSSSGEWAQPWESYSGGGFYTTVAPYSPTSVVTIDFTGWLANQSFSSVQSLSLYWGSMDSYQWLEVLDRDGGVLGTIMGSDVASPTANGDQGAAGTNRIVNLAFNGADGAAFAGLRFNSTQAAFEFDDIAIQGISRANTTVPEPSTYALMAAGLAGLFGVARRRKQNG